MTINEFHMLGNQVDNRKKKSIIKEEQMTF